jgi:SAM-dependent methyltransferase/GR25 family glycosyltransferase involved in LPS biosynthesis
LAHEEQKQFCLSIKQKFPEFFHDKWVLDVGSLDINGNNQYLFTQCGYLGLDLLPGKNVDLVSAGHELQLPDATFDVIISTECFEHDQYYDKTIVNIVRMLKPGGLFLFSCATIGRPEHGTRRTTPEDAPFTGAFGDWGDYYKNLEESDVRSVLNIELYFSCFEFSSQHKTHDLYFWGVKHGVLPSRADYSFHLPESSLQRVHETLLMVEAEAAASALAVHEESMQRAASEARLSATETRLTLTETRLSETETRLTLTETRLSETETRLSVQQAHAALLEEERRGIIGSTSWRITRPMRAMARLGRGQVESIRRMLTLLRRGKNALAYLARGDWRGLRERIAFYRAPSNSTEHSLPITTDVDDRWCVVTPNHTLFVAHLIAERLLKNGIVAEIMTSMPQDFTHCIYVVLCPQIFDRLPPAERRIVFQMEQSVSSRWFTLKYLNLLDNSFAVIDYSLKNIEFLHKLNISHPHVHYLPIGASADYGHNVTVDNKKYHVLFYGDSFSSPRRGRLLDALKEQFDVHVVNDLFGEEMIRTVKEARVVINLHYYENALLEMPRLQECLSLGVRVVSESAQDQSDYPELGDAVTFFEEGSIEGMLEAVKRALAATDDAPTLACAASQKRFAFMFDRFLIAKGFLPVTHVAELTLPLLTGRDTFALSMPETIVRRRVFEKICPEGCAVFDGIVRSPGWIGCGLSYAALARHALQNGLKTITVMEDDVVLPPDYEDARKSIDAFLQSKNGEWDVFSGMIADLHPDTVVSAVEIFDGRTFVTVNKMTSMVYNIYTERTLRLFCEWNPDNDDVATNTIDRYLEGLCDLRVIVMLPFFVGHREEVTSTLWEFSNQQYSSMISASESLLRRKITDYSAERARSQSTSQYVEA